MRRLFSRDTFTGITRWFHDHGDGSWSIEAVQDAEALLESNKRSYAATDEHASWGEGRTVARIPALIAYELVEKGIFNPDMTEADPKRFKRWLNDNEHLYFRTRPGRI